MNANSLITLFLTVVILTSCDRDDRAIRGCGDFTMHHEVKDFGVFDVGTYWVYENQLTLERDTFTVYAFDYIYEGTKEVGFWTRMKRTYENAEFQFLHDENQNVIPVDNPCEIRRTWMYRVDFDSQGMVNSMEESKLLFPVVKGNRYFSFCGNNGAEVMVEDVWEEDILTYQNVSTFSITGPAFSLNPCIGENYRYQFAQGIGLVSWENLDSLDGKWLLIEFEVQ